MKIKDYSHSPVPQASASGSTLFSDLGAFNSVGDTIYTSNNTEFANYMQLIALSAANQANVPDLGTPFSFRPENLPPKDPQEERRHRQLVEENRRLYFKAMKQKERELEQKKIENIKKDKRLNELKHYWEEEIIPYFDSL